MIARSLSMLAAVQLFMTPLAASALTATAHDCDEGADFIANAARSRDNGLSSEAFFARFDGDLQLLQSLPPEMRWFVQDADDEALLRSAAIEVFTAQRTPDEHAREFLARCRDAIDAAARTHAPLPVGAADAT